MITASRSTKRDWHGNWEQTLIEIIDPGRWQINFSSKDMKKMICLLVIIMFSVPVYAEKLNMMVGIEENTEGFSATKRILDVISERINVKFNLTSVPSGRANVILESSYGAYAGELVVSEGRKIKNPDIIKVAEPWYQTSIVAIALNKAIKIKGWESLKGYKLIHLRGWSAVEVPLKKFNLTSKPIDSTKAALYFLLAKRADIFLVVPIVVEKALNQPIFKNKDFIILKPAVGLINFHTYFFKQHSLIAHKFNNALKAIKKDGSYMRALASEK